MHQSLSHTSYGSHYFPIFLDISFCSKSCFSNFLWPQDLKHCSALDQFGIQWESNARHHVCFCSCTRSCSQIHHQRPSLVYFVPISFIQLIRSCLWCTSPISSEHSSLVSAICSFRRTLFTCIISFSTNAAPLVYLHAPDGGAGSEHLLDQSLPPVNELPDTIDFCDFHSDAERSYCTTICPHSLRGLQPVRLHLTWNKTTPSQQILFILSSTESLSFITCSPSSDNFLDPGSYCKALLNI